MIKIDDLKRYEHEIIGNYKHLHKHPELAFEECETSAFIQNKLKEYGIESEQIALTGVVATIKGGKTGKTIALRSDIDALPLTEVAQVDYKSQNEGIMHACGHDAHISMLLGAAKYLEENKGQISGNIRLIFQPAEEGVSNLEVYERALKQGAHPGGGAKTMIKYGALDGVDMCIALHTDPLAPVATLRVNLTKAMASCDKFTLEICGKGGHGASPDTAIDTIGALSAVLAAYNQYPSRELSALDNCVVTVGTVNTDSSWNIIPEKIVLTGTVRTFDKVVREKAHERLIVMAENICKAYRCTANFIRFKSYSPTINNPEIALKMVKVANESFKEGAGKTSDIPSMAAEDVGEYFEQVPGALGWIGLKDEKDGGFALHNPKFCLDLNGLKYGTLFHINMSLDFLSEK